MIFETTRFGSLEIPDEEVIVFPEGIPGFSGRRYVLFHNEDAPLVQWLQSVDEPDVALMTVDPGDLLLAYAPNFDEADIRPVCLAAGSGDERQVRVIIRNAEIAGHLRINLFAPLLFNVDKRLGMQVPLLGSSHPVSALWPPASSENS
ncbi:MAG: flagellar assembly protein FliW [Myxococcales bacterium]|nr:flagellar assembly protein FliW [Myxococcales bacterium]